MTNDEEINELKYIQLAVNSRVSEAFDMAIKALEQMPTDYQQGYVDGVNQMVKELKVERQKSGKWIETDEGFSPYECSVCGSIEFKGSKYCPNCGARMESEG